MMAREFFIMLSSLFPRLNLIAEKTDDRILNKNSSPIIKNRTINCLVKVFTKGLSGRRVGLLLRAGAMSFGMGFILGYIWCC